MSLEKRKFDAEIGKVLNLMIYSLYTNKEIFMRELISNASDACDKLRYLSISSPDLIADDPNFKITIKVDKDKRELTISDNGIGMTKEQSKNILNRDFIVSSHNVDEKRGSGLGYLIIRDLLKIIEAEIVIKSELNKGTTIKIIFS